MDTFLEVVQRFVSEVGVAGGSGPSSIATGETLDGVNRVIHYVKDAHQYVCDLWPDWDFLWALEEGTVTAAMVTAGDTTLPVLTPPARAYPFGDSSFQIKRGSSWQNLRYMDWRDFRQAHRVGTPRTAGFPVNWTVRPNKQIELSHPVGSEFEYRYEYYSRAAELSADSDPILVPIPRTVLCRAKIIFAERENAPEIMHGAAAEYSELIEHLESLYTPGFAGGRTREEHLVVRDA